MEKKRLTKEEVVADIKGMFEITPFDKRKNGKSFIAIKENETSFYFDKNQYTRDDIINKLINYFEDKVIIGGKCVIEPMTILHTIVSIEDNN